MGLADGIGTAVTCTSHAGKNRLGTACEVSFQSLSIIPLRLCSGSRRLLRMLSRGTAPFDSRFCYWSNCRRFSWREIPVTFVALNREPSITTSRLIAVTQSRHLRSLVVNADSTNGLRLAGFRVLGESVFIQNELYRTRCPAREKMPLMCRHSVAVKSLN